MPNYREENISTVQDYVALIDKEELQAERSGKETDSLFRGQRRDKPLLPKIARLKLRGEINEIEKLLIEEFTRGLKGSCRDY